MTAPQKSLGIGILSARFPPAYVGGAELQAAGLAQRLAQRHRVFVLTRDGGEDNVRRRCADQRVHVSRRPRWVFPVRPLIDIVASLLELRRLRTQIDVLVAYQVYIDGLIGALARRWLGLPLVVWIRGEGEVLPRSSARTRLLSAPVLASSDAILTQSPRLAELAEAFLANEGGRDRFPRVQVIPNGVELGETDSAGDRAGVLFVGRLVQRKGVDLLIRAMRDLDGPSLTIVGDGPERARLEALAGGGAHFVGQASPAEVRRRMASAAVLALPARHGEGLPNVLLEAMAGGLPVVATDVGGIADVVRHRQSGLLVPPGDRRRLARELAALLADAELRGRLAQAGREVAARHDWTGVVDTVEGLLQRVATGTGGAA